MKNFKDKKILHNIVVFIFMMMFILQGCTKEESVLYSENDSENGLKLDSEVKNSDIDKGNEEISDIEEDNEQVYYVQLSGAVKKPGVYRFEKKVRLFEAVEEAGGLREDACTDGINLAVAIEDEIFVRIPTIDEYEEQRQALSQQEADSLLHNGNIEITERNKLTAEKNDGRININTASIQELMTLPGIGEAKAKAIIDYRDKNGSFTDISQIMQISGIKESVYNKVKDLIVV